MKGKFVTPGKGSLLVKAIPVGLGTPATREVLQKLGFAYNFPRRRWESWVFSGELQQLRVDYPGIDFEVIEDMRTNKGRIKPLEKLTKGQQREAVQRLKEAKQAINRALRALGEAS